MARYVIDMACALRRADAGVETIADHTVLAPTLLRSQVLDQLYRQSTVGALDEAAARRLNTQFARLKLRYLGDAVLQRRAWDIASALGMPTTFDAEYIALTQLQADALVTEDRRLAALAARRVAVAPFQALGLA